jgi:hypothetical protein
MSLDLFSAQEHQMVMEAADKYGAFYVNAYNTTILLSNMVMWPVVDCDLFLRFLSQMKKHHSLSLLSTVRLHQIQAKLTLRYFLESTVHAAFSVVHLDTKNYLDLDNQKVGDPQRASRQAYKWIEGAFSSHSEAIQRIKDQINAHTAHSHVLNSQHNFALVPGERPEIVTSFFDFEDDEWVKVDLWQCAQAGLIAIDLLLAVQKQHGVFLPSRETEGLGPLIADHEALLSELGSTSTSTN